MAKAKPPNIASRKNSASQVGMPPRFWFLLLFFLAVWASRFWRAARSCGEVDGGDGCVERASTGALGCGCVGHIGEQVAIS